MGEVTLKQRIENNVKVIAIVEDDANLAIMFEDMLGQISNGKWRFHIFADGYEAMKHLPQLGAHLILLDVGLPNLDGVSLFKLLRGYSSTKNTPIIVITGSYDWELHRLGLQGGWLLHKPFEIKELLEIVHALLPVG